MDAELVLGGLVGLLAHVFGDVRACAGDQVVERARGELEAQRILDDRSEALVGEGLVRIRTERTVIRRRIGNPPLDVEVDIDRLLLGREITLRLRFQVEDTAVVTHHLLDQRQLVMQAGRIFVGGAAAADDTAELQDQRTLALGHDERAVGDQPDEQQGEDGSQQFHWLFSLPAFLASFALDAAAAAVAGSRSEASLSSGR